MGFVIAGAVILFILIVLILIPKAAKPFVKKEKNWGRGFSRIYIVLAALYSFFMAVLESDFIFGEDPNVAAKIFVFIIVFVPLMLVFYILRWVFRGFKN